MVLLHAKEEIYYADLTLAIMEAEKSHDLPYKLETQESQGCNSESLKASREHRMLRARGD